MEAWQTARSLKNRIPFLTLGSKKCLHLKWASFWFKNDLWTDMNTSRPLSSYVSGVSYIHANESKCRNRSRENKKMVVTCTAKEGNSFFLSEEHTCPTKFVISQGNVELLNFSCAKVGFALETLCLWLEKLWKVNKMVWFTHSIFFGGTNDIHGNLRIYNHLTVDESSYQLTKYSNVLVCIFN